MRKRLGKTTNKKLIRKLFDSALEKSVDVSGIEEWDVEIKFPSVLNLLTNAQKIKITTLAKNQSLFKLSEGEK